MEVLVTIFFVIIIGVLVKIALIENKKYSYEDKRYNSDNKKYKRYEFEGVYYYYNSDKGDLFKLKKGGLKPVITGFELIPYYDEYEEETKLISRYGFIVEFNKKYVQLRIDADLFNKVFREKEFSVYGTSKWLCDDISMSYYRSIHSYASGASMTSNRDTIKSLSSLWAHRQEEYFKEKETRQPYEYYIPCDEECTKIEYNATKEILIWERDGWELTKCRGVKFVKPSLDELHKHYVLGHRLNEKDLERLSVFRD